MAQLLNARLKAINKVLSGDLELIPTFRHPVKTLNVTFSGYLDDY